MGSEMCIRDRLNGKNTFHATQMARWQRGPEKDMIMKYIKPSDRECLQVPHVMEELFPAEVVTGKVPPKSTEDTQIQWFKESDKKGSLEKATAQDNEFILKWADED